MRANGWRDGSRRWPEHRRRSARAEMANWLAPLRTRPRAVTRRAGSSARMLLRTRRLRNTQGAPQRNLTDANHMADGVILCSTFPLLPPRRDAEKLPQQHRDASNPASRSHPPGVDAAGVGRPGRLRPRGDGLPSPYPARGSDTSSENHLARRLASSSNNLEKQRLETNL